MCWNQLPLAILRRTLLVLIVLLCCSGYSWAAGGTLRVKVPADVKVASATAVVPSMKLETPGKVDGSTLVFDNVLPETDYAIHLKLTDGTIIEGVNLTWYTEEPAKADAGPISDDDRKELLAILRIPDFYNKKDILLLQGDHTRAAALVRLVRDKDFYAGQGQVIWRIETYYCRNQHGGWEIINQQNRILHRERFKSIEAYKAGTEKLKFSAALGAVRLDKGKSDQTIEISALEAVQ